MRDFSTKIKRIIITFWAVSFCESRKPSEWTTGLIISTKSAWWFTAVSFAKAVSTGTSCCTHQCPGLHMFSLILLLRWFLDSWIESIVSYCVRIRDVKWKGQYVLFQVKLAKSMEPPKLPFLLVGNKSDLHASRQTKQVHCTILSFSFIIIICSKLTVNRKIVEKVPAQEQWRLIRIIYLRSCKALYVLIGFLKKFSWSCFFWNRDFKY